MNTVQDDQLLSSPCVGAAQNVALNEPTKQATNTTHWSGLFTVHGSFSLRPTQASSIVVPTAATRCGCSATKNRDAETGKNFIVSWRG